MLVIYKDFFFCTLLVTEKLTLRGNFLYLNEILNRSSFKYCVIINNFQTGVHTSRFFSRIYENLFRIRHTVSFVAIWYFPSRAVSILLSIYYLRTISQKLICFSDRCNYRISPMPSIDNICGHIISLRYVFFFLKKK